jgi:heat shock protein HslJ
MLLMMLLLSMACSPHTQMPPQNPAADLAGTSWQLVKFQGSDDTTLTPNDKAKYTVAFEADDRVSARIDCNRGRGTWKSSAANQLQFGPLALTRAICPPGSLHDRIVKHWEFVRSYTIRDGQLFLALMADGGIYGSTDRRIEIRCIEIAGRVRRSVTPGHSQGGNDTLMRFSTDTQRPMLVERAGRIGIPVVAASGEIRGQDLMFGRRAAALVNWSNVRKCSHWRAVCAQVDPARLGCNLGSDRRNLTILRNESQNTLCAPCRHRSFSSNRCSRNQLPTASCGEDARSNCARVVRITSTKSSDYLVSAQYEDQSLTAESVLPPSVMSQFSLVRLLSR